MKRMTIRPSFVKIIFCVVLDMFLSIFLSFILFLGFGWLAGSTVYQTFDAILDGVQLLAGAIPRHQDDIFVITFTLTTLMTSLWAVLLMVAAIMAKAATGLDYIMRLTNRMFDVDAHPVRVLGLVAGAVIWVCSLVYAVI